MTRLFGTDGVRGLANGDLTAELALDLSVAAAHVLADRGEFDGPPPARRRRPGHPHLRASSSRPPSWPGWPRPASTCCCSACCRPRASPTSPTSSAPTSASMLSASHNPMPDNGIKFLARGGHKLDDADRDARSSGGCARTWQRPTGGDVGRVDAVRHRRRRVRRPPGPHHRPPARRDQGRPRLRRGRGLARPGPRALRDAGADVVAIHAMPDGLNINDGCGSTHLESLQAAVLEDGADVGFALDGDADRCLAVDHEGNVVDGDQILAILALALHGGRPPRQGHRRRHRDEQPRLRPGDARGRASASGRPRSATATCSRR